MEWYLKVLRQYVDFKGRARRTEYWMFFLVNFLIGLGIVIIELVLKTHFFSCIYFLATLVPFLGVKTRRLHDIGKSSMWLIFFYGIAALIADVIAVILAGMLAIRGTLTFVEKLFTGFCANGTDEVRIILLEAIGIYALMFIGLGIPLLVFYCTEGTKGPNKYGEDPKNPKEVSVRIEKYYE